MIIDERLQRVFRNVFDQPQLTVNEHTTADDVDGWDSITHLDLIVAIEKEFNLQISGFEVMQLHNVGDLQSLITRKTSA